MALRPRFDAGDAATGTLDGTTGELGTPTGGRPPKCRAFHPATDTIGKLSRPRI